MENSPKRVLIVEDETSLRGALVDALTRKGFSCTEAVDGEAGLSDALTQKPDLILLDVLMPKLDGMEMLKKLRADGWGKGARVLILTNLSADNSERVRSVVETAPDLYLVKSDWSIGDIVGKASELLHQ